MAKPSAVIPQWAVTANFGSTNYPAKILSTDPTAAASMTTWITLVSAATAVAAPTDFGEILHPNAGAGTPWSLTANKEPTGLAAFANTGFEPALPIKSESFNQWLGNIWEYVDWLRLASAAADLDDHVVQTDATGATALAKILAGGTALADSAAVFTSNSAGACVSITDTIGQFALLVAGSSALAGIRTTQTGTGSAIEAILSGGSATGSALSGDAGPVGAFGVDGDGGTTGVGVRGVGGSTSGDGVVGDGNVAGHGVQGTSGSATGAGVSGTSSQTAGAGVEGTNTSVNGVGIEGSTVALATVSATAVRGVTGTGDATAVKGDSSSGDGYAGFFFATVTTPDRASVRMVPQSADPTTHATGDLYYSSPTTTLKTRTASGWQHVLASDEGYCHGDGSSASGAQNSVTFSEKVTAGIASPHDPKVVGDVTISVSGQFRNAAAALNTVRVRLRDKTAAVTIATYDIRLSETNATVITDLSTAFEKTISVNHIGYTLPGTGARTFSVEIASDTAGGTGIDYANLHIEVRGVY